MSSNPDVKENQEANQPQTQEESKPLFSGIDSQGKERLFTDVEDAQKSWQSSQDFIKTTVTENKSLEARIQELEAQLNQSTKLDEALAQLQTKEETPVTEQQNQQTTESTPQLDVEQIETQLLDKIMGKLTQEQQKEVFAKNQQESIEAAKSVFGESYEDKLRSVAQDMGMSDTDIIQEAQSNPKRFKKLFGLERQQSTNFVPNSSTSVPAKNTNVQLNLGKGFSAKDKLSSHLSDLQAIAKQKGLDINF